MSRKRTVLTGCALVALLLTLLGAGVGVGVLVYPGWMNDRFEVQDLPIEGFTARTLLIGKVNHDEQIPAPLAGDMGKPDRDFSRLAMTYYHRNGPAGRAFETMNWFGGPENTYWADARMPASLVGQLAGVSGLPLAPLVDLWSEPPVGKLFVAAGGIASYARPFQWVDFYERNPQITALSLPTDGTSPRYTLIEQARRRGANVRVFPGDERKTLAEKGPRGFYKLLIVELLHGGTSYLGQSLVSDDLMTKEAMALYFDSITDDGIVLIHTSNRAYDLPAVLADAAASLGLTSVHVQDNPQLNGGRPAAKGHFSSEWVLIARRPEHLAEVKRHVDAAGPNGTIQWRPLQPTGRPVWVDGASHSFAALRR